RTRLRTRHPPVGGRADRGAAALVPPPTHPLGDSQRHPRSVHDPGMRDQLLPPTDQMIISLGVLRPIDLAGGVWLHERDLCLPSCEDHSLSAVPLWAHSPAPGSDSWHALQDHLIGTARLARRFAAPFGGGEVAYWLVALHDVGKAACGWPEKLALVSGKGQPVGIDHKNLGARIAYERGLGP